LTRCFPLCPTEIRTVIKTALGLPIRSAQSQTKSLQEARVKASPSKYCVIKVQVYSCSEGKTPRIIKLGSMCTWGCRPIDAVEV